MRDARNARTHMGEYFSSPYCHHFDRFIAQKDNDPAVTEDRAATRPLVLWEAPGIGFSKGQVLCPSRKTARDCANFSKALHISKIDSFGFFMGGYTAQMLVLDYPALVRRLILVGALPSIGKGLTPPPARPFVAYRKAKAREAFVDLSFRSCEKSHEAAWKSWARLIASRPNHIVDVGRAATREQLTAFAKFIKLEFAH